MAAVEFRKVDIIFGKNPEAAIGLLDGGQDREAILEATGNVLGVADASLAIEEGEICVLMGLSGSGKSTLLRAVNRLNKVTRGQVLVQDDDTQIDVASCDAATLRRLRTSRIAMVFQQFALLPWRTVHENVGLGLELRGMAKPERDLVVDEKLKLVGLDQWKDKYGHELSGGMQQRVGLARAFATDADILLMDEPFSALDPLIRDHLQDELLELQRRPGRGPETGLSHRDHGRRPDRPVRRAGGDRAGAGQPLRGRVRRPHEPDQCAAGRLAHDSPGRDRAQGQQAAARLVGPSPHDPGPRRRAGRG
jgi:glycine betaine/proline transport system ATP-binding protein